MDVDAGRIEQAVAAINALVERRAQREARPSLVEGEGVVVG